MDDANEWLRRANEDLEESLVARAPRISAHYAQQAAEKAVKALICGLGGHPDHTHNILDLMLSVYEMDKRLGTHLLLSYGNAGARLTEFAGGLRFDVEVPAPRAKAAVETARGIVAAVRTVVDGVRCQVRGGGHDGEGD